MDKEIYIIHTILKNTLKPLTTKEIADDYSRLSGYRISKTIVKNYLWSYFREIIKFNSGDFTYALKGDKYLFTDVVCRETNDQIRPICTSAKTGKILIEFDKSITMVELIEAIGIVNFRTGGNFYKSDLIKSINRIIEQNR
jgi:hypothetical protein